MQAKKEHIFFFDFLRCYAVTSVVFYHFPLFENNIHIKYLYSCLPSVPLFFVLIGFLITRILLAKKEKHTKKEIVFNFYIRRILRISLIYYIVLFLLLVFNFHIYKHQFFYDFFYVSNIKVGFDGSYNNTIAPHFWSLSVEEQFYLLWPLFLIYFKNKKVLLFSLLLFLLGVVVFIISYNYSSYALFFVDRTIGNFSYLGLGCSLSILQIKVDLIGIFKKYFFHITLFCSST